MKSVKSNSVRNGDNLAYDNINLILKQGGFHEDAIKEKTNGRHHILKLKNKKGDQHLKLLLEQTLHLNVQVSTTMLVCISK